MHDDYDYDYDEQAGQGFRPVTAEQINELIASADKITYFGRAYDDLAADRAGEICVNQRASNTEEWPEEPDPWASDPEPWPGAAAPAPPINPVQEWPKPQGFWKRLFH